MSTCALETVQFSHIKTGSKKPIVGYFDLFDIMEAYSTAKAKGSSKVMGVSTKQNHMNHCVLQVEDEEADIFLMRRAFRQADIHNPLLSVNDGQMAIDYLTGAGEFADRGRFPLPCLILLDLKLPKKSGLEVLEWIRQQPNLNKTVVIVFSSSCQNSDVVHAYDLGANSYIQKPSNMKHTMEVVRLLKDWWLGYNLFAPQEETVPA